MAIEKPQYRAVQVLQGIEVREYAPYLVAETEVSGSREQAGNAGFRRLAGYIFGKNRGEKKIAMTAPVAQQDGARIAMTAPVSQQERLERGPSTWVIQFMMPSEYARDTLPEPLDPAVRFREVPARRVVAPRYSGTWSEERYLEKPTELRAAMEKEGLRAVGEPVWARYDPPYMPWFLRTNEILVEIAPRGPVGPDHHRLVRERCAQPVRRGTGVRARYKCPEVAVERIGPWPVDRASSAP